MEIYAHRGASSTHPENTMAAFRQAAELTITGVELDVHMTKDGEVVVIHDEKIDRTSNGQGFVKDYTLAQLREFDFGSWFDERFTGEKIPTLTEVLALFAATTQRVNIELKSDVFMYEGLEQKVLAIVKEHQMATRVIISSFDHEALQRVYALDKNIEIAALFGTVVIDIETYTKRIPAQAMHVTLPSAFRNSIAQALRHDNTVRVYTVNDVLYAQELALLGVDSIFTDQPAEMAAFFA